MRRPHLPEVESFADLPLDRRALLALERIGYEQPTPIQAKFIPEAATGRDCIGQAQTGTGKTAAYLLPILQRIHTDGLDPQAIVLAPTRELAVQIVYEGERLANGFGVYFGTLVGGHSLRKQIEDLRRGCQIVVGTPGRVIHHLRNGDLPVRDIRHVVLDEADRMLDIGFRPDIEKILRQLPRERQTLLLSATMEPPVRRLASRYMVNPVEVEIPAETKTVESIRQTYFAVPQQRKAETLLRLITRDEPPRCIIFCKRKVDADDLARRLARDVDGVTPMHGDMEQNRRNAIMAKFREGRIRFLVSTDLVGRGIDVDNITHVINFDIPEDPENYVHRIGRTARMGKDGVAYTFVTPGQGKELNAIEKLIDKEIPTERVDDLPQPAPPRELSAPHPPPPPVHAVGAMDRMREHEHAAEVVRTHPDVDEGAGPHREAPGRRSARDWPREEPPRRRPADGPGRHEPKPRRSADSPRHEDPPRRYREDDAPGRRSAPAAHLEPPPRPAPPRREPEDPLPPARPAALDRPAPSPAARPPYLDRPVRPQDIYMEPMDGGADDYDDLEFGAARASERQEEEIDRFDLPEPASERRPKPGFRGPRGRGDERGGGSGRGRRSERPREAPRRTDARPSGGDPRRRDSARPADEPPARRGSGVRFEEPWRSRDSRRRDEEPPRSHRRGHEDDRDYPDADRARGDYEPHRGRGSERRPYEEDHRPEELSRPRRPLRPREPAGDPDRRPYDDRPPRRESARSRPSDPVDRERGHRDRYDSTDDFPRGDGPAPRRGDRGADRESRYDSGRPRGGNRSDAPDSRRHRDEPPPRRRSGGDSRGGRGRPPRR